MTKHPQGDPVTPELIARKVTPEYLDRWGKPKWAQFCETLLEEGFRVFLYMARRTNSKYVYVSKASGVWLKIRFSDHKANLNQEKGSDSDYYVGRGNFGAITTGQVLQEVRNYFIRARVPQ